MGPGVVLVAVDPVLEVVRVAVVVVVHHAAAGLAVAHTVVAAVVGLATKGNVHVVGTVEERIACVFFDQGKPRLLLNTARPAQDLPAFVRSVHILGANASTPDVAIVNSNLLWPHANHALDVILRLVKGIAEDPGLEAQRVAQHGGELVHKDAIVHACPRVAHQRRLHRTCGDTIGLDDEVLEHDRHDNRHEDRLDVVAPGCRPSSLLWVLTLGVSVLALCLFGHRDLGHFFFSPSPSTDRNAFCGISTLPIERMRRLPFFCFSSSLRLRVMSPP